MMPRRYLCNRSCIATFLAFFIFEEEIMSDTRSNTTRNLALAAMFIAIGLVLPFLTGQIPEIGRMLLPMHIPVLLCGLICGRGYGLMVGFILPLLRGALFGMPVLFPMGVSMAFELATYGFAIGLIYHLLGRKNELALFISLIGAMIVGRIVWGIAFAILMGLSGGVFTWQLFIGGALLNAIPGIILQLILIPLIMIALDRAGFVRFNRST